MKNTASRKTAALAVAGSLTLAVSVLAPVSQQAVAGTTPSCDASLVTLTLTSASDGTPLADAEFEVSTKAGVFVAQGNHTGKEGDFRTALNVALPTADTLSESESAAARNIAAAYVNATAMADHPGYPVDITGLVGEQLQNSSALAYIERGDWIAFKDDVADRYATVNLVAAEAAAYAEHDSAFAAQVTEVNDKLAALQGNVEALETAAGAGNWSGFVDAYDFLVDHDNWAFGISKTPTLKLVDSIVTPDFSAANTAAANTALEAEPATSITLTTNAAGQIDFTLMGLGVWEYSADGDSRGLNDCGQLTADIEQVGEVANHEMDPELRTVTSLDNKTGALNVVNYRLDATKPTAPERTNAGV